MEDGKGNGRDPVSDFRSAIIASLDESGGALLAWENPKMWLVGVLDSLSREDTSNG